MFSLLWGPCYDIQAFQNQESYRSVKIFEYIVLVKIYLNSIGHNSYITKLVLASVYEILLEYGHNKFVLLSPKIFEVCRTQKVLLKSKFCLETREKYYKPFLTSPEQKWFIVMTFNHNSLMSLETSLVRNNLLIFFVWTKIANWYKFGTKISYRNSEKDGQMSDLLENSKLQSCYFHHFYSKRKNFIKHMIHLRASGQ